MVTTNRLLGYHAILLALGFCLLASSAWAKDEKHPYGPLLLPITEKPKPTALTPEEEAKLKGNKVVLRQVETADGGYGVAIQDISASVETVWNTILAYDRYPDWVDNVANCTVYKSPKPNVLYVDMEISVMFVSSHLYTINTVNREAGYMTWILDRDRKSSVKDTVGYWMVSPHPKDPKRSRVEYSSQMIVSGIPEFIANFLTRDSLENGTVWVKKRAEEAAAKAK